LTKVPEVSEKGDMGNSTSLNSILALKGLMVTTIWALANWVAAEAAAALSDTGSVLSSKTALSVPPNIW
jgi:hypothetical protein